jgi:SAM-dependent methyltransferase
MLFPPHTWSILRQELHLAACRFKNKLVPTRRMLLRRWGKLQGLKLHLGCGRRIFPGWVNVDAYSGPGVDLTWDLRYRLPFGDGSSHLIYSEHVLEHLHQDEALDLLRECWRMLQPGGVIRIGVPDASLYLASYAVGDTAFFANLRHLGGAVEPLDNPIDVVNQMFRMGGSHHFAWDYPALRTALGREGFGTVRRWNAGEASQPELCRDDPAHAFETLYVEAVKPSIITAR